MPDYQSIFDVFIPRKAGVASSPAPGVGPSNIGSERRTPKQATAVIPPNAPPDTVGYGGGADPVIVRSDDFRRMEAAHYEHLEHIRAGQPFAPSLPQVRFNQFYDIFHTTQAWRHSIQNTAHGAWIVGTTVVQSVTLDIDPNLQVAQYPGAIMCYPVLTFFSFAPSVVTATGEFSFIFIPQGSKIQYPLGEFTAAQAYTATPEMIIEVPLLDPHAQNLGFLIITSNSVTGTPTLFWRMGFAFAYLETAASMRRAASEQARHEPREVEVIYRAN